MDDFLKSLGTLDWVVIYAVTILLCVGSVLRIVSRVQKIRLRRIQLRGTHLDNEPCPAIKRIAEVFPDLCPQCRGLLKAKVKED